MSRSPVCIACVDAGAEFDYCRACGRGDPRFDPNAPGASPPPTAPSEPRHLFSGPRPSDPIAQRGSEGSWMCHCGTLLDGRPVSDGKMEGAPGPIVPCSSCGCFVAMPDTEEER